MRLLISFRDVRKSLNVFDHLRRTQLVILEALKYNKRRWNDADVGTWSTALRVAMRIVKIQHGSVFMSD